jgi:hypothetical protein
MHKVWNGHGGMSRRGLGRICSVWNGKQTLIYQVVENYHGAIALPDRPHQPSTPLSSSRPQPTQT